MSSPFVHFKPVHGLTQLVEHNSNTYILVSTVSEDLDAWNLHVSLSDGGRWWTGAWHDADVRAIAGTHTSSKMLTAFATRLAETIVRRELAITHKGEFADMKLTLGPKAKKPLHVELKEMSAQETASFATAQFLQMARDAQSRGCRFLPSAASDALSRSSQPPATPSKPRHPSRHDTETVSTVRADRTGGWTFHAASESESDARPSSLLARSPRRAGKGKRKEVLSSEDESDNPTYPRSKKAKTLAPSGPTEGELAALAQVRKLKGELAKAAEREKELDRELARGTSFGGSTDKLRSRTVLPALRRRPGASLANPTQKARRLEPVEFASDSD